MGIIICSILYSFLNPMHRLKEITIRNFRSVKSENFTLSDYTALIGYNNAGKTNILLACKWLLRKWSLAESEFHDKESPVEVESVVSGISSEILERLPKNQAQATLPFLVDETLHIKRVQNRPGERAADIRLFVKGINPDTQEETWSPAPTGLDTAMNDLFPEPILIGATENIEEDVTKNKTSTTIGRLISEIITPIEEKYGDEARRALEFLKKTLDADGEERAEELRVFDDQANEKLQVLFPSVSIKLHIPTPELKEVFKSGTIKVYEDGQVGGRDISSFGSGAQRSIQMALIRQLAEVRKGADLAPARTLLLIDEPELYLHPHAIEQVRVALKQLSKEGYQVIFATHSAQMVKSEDVNNALLIRKDRENGTYRRRKIDEAIRQILDDHDHDSQMELLFALSHSHQILFAECVLLTEGTTEHIVLPKILEAITGGETFGTIKCALVRQGGVNNTKRSMDILYAMDIPTKAIVDLDYAFGQAIQCGLIAEDDPDVLACKQVFVEMEGRGEVILENGLPTKRGQMNTREAFFFMASQPAVLKNIENLHQKLTACNIWLWKKGMIEKHLGIRGKGMGVWSRFNERVDTEGCQAVIPDFQEVERLVAWIRG